MGLDNITKEVNVCREEKKNPRNFQRLEAKEQVRAQQERQEAAREAGHIQETVRPGKQLRERFQDGD